MSSRPLKGPYPVILNQSMATSITSLPTIINNLSMIGYTYSWAGTSPVGLITVEVSNDYRQNSDGSTSVPGTWNQLTLSGAAAVSGNTGNGSIDIATSGFYAIRTVYTATSGTGVLNAIVSQKVA